MLPLPGTIIYGITHLDNDYPYTDRWFTTNDIWDGEADSPFEPLEGDASIVEKMLLDDFDCWYMFMPPGVGSIAVPIRKINWFWQFDAAKTGGIWSVSNNLSQAGVAEAYPAFPVWDKRLINEALMYRAP